MLNRPPTIMLTIDVEDWFQVENFKSWIPFSSWSSRELRVEKNTHRLLDLFDSIETAGRLESDEAGKHKTVHNLQPSSSQTSQHPGIPASQPPSLNPSRHLSESRPKATFFVLGWIAERLPDLIREIKRRGHEVASHGYAHNLCYQLQQKDLKADLVKSKELLENIIGESVYGYRAPSFSVTEDILKVIQDCGYLYDSSYNSFGLHDRYGKIDLSKYDTTDFAIRISKNFYELPISNLKLSFNPINSTNSTNPSNPTNPSHPTNPSNSTNPFSFELPWGGGGYFRMIPFTLFKYGVQKILSKKNVYLFYMHPWEIDPEQPRMREASRQFKFRHYINLSKTEFKLARLIKYFNQCHFITCKQYIDKKDMNVD